MADFADDYTSPLDNLLQSTSTRTLQYERQLKELEVSHLDRDGRLYPYPCVIRSQSFQNT